MSHDLDFSTGTAAMAYVGALPWHGFGATLDPGAPIETWIEAARLDWNIRRAQVGYKDQHGNVHTVDDKRVLFRDDTGGALSVMSDSRYNVVQPKEVLEFYRDLVDATEGDYELETAGALKGGRKIWALARRKNTANILGNDEVRPYLMLATACDGSLSTVAKFTTIRVVCNNTLSIANRREKRDIRVPHSRKFDPKKVKEELGLLDGAFDDFISDATKLATVKVTQEQAVDYFARLYGPAKTLSLDEALPNADEFSTRQKNTINALTTHFNNGPGANLASANGTAWGLVNAVTHFQDFHAPTRGDESNRFASAQFGEGEKQKEKAVYVAHSIAERELLAA